MNLIVKESPKVKIFKIKKKLTLIRPLAWASADPVIRCLARTSVKPLVRTDTCVAPTGAAAVSVVCGAAGAAGAAARDFHYNYILKPAQGADKGEGSPLC